MHALKKEEIASIDETQSLAELNIDIQECWKYIAPAWPLKNIIAANPISGFENLDFKDALQSSTAHFRYQHLPKEMQNVNRESIKWLNAFFDQGQATITMPKRELGLYQSVIQLLPHDTHIPKDIFDHICNQTTYTPSPLECIITCSTYLNLKSNERSRFYTLLLTTLPGWASYIQYRTTWADTEDSLQSNTVTQTEYLAVRILLTALLWKDAKQLLSWHDENYKAINIDGDLHKIIDLENRYKYNLYRKLSSISTSQTSKTKTKAQFVFCIDVRSEQLRRSLEAQGAYETFGFAGFFGLPIAIEDKINNQSYASCPVLLKPQHTVVCYENDASTHENTTTLIKKAYQSLKYNFTTPLALVESLGGIYGILLLLKSFLPKKASKFFIKKKNKKELLLHDISLEKQVIYAESALSMIGLKNILSEIVIFCGHGSATENNAFASGLDCGACGGRHGAFNAKLLAQILNNTQVRTELCKKEIKIPDSTFFLAALHTTTTDHVTLFDTDLPEDKKNLVEKIKKDLEIAQHVSLLSRKKTFENSTTSQDSVDQYLKAIDWSEVRPEWGLARNGSFIIGNRSLTTDIDLEGRSFLHSYNWKDDESFNHLRTILTAPVIVAQWINTQYLFSTLDNAAYGAGSKVTKNISGKIAIMQGNASDLMTGLPLQSVYYNDLMPYHEPMRLRIIIDAPKAAIVDIIKSEPTLRSLTEKEWIHFVQFDTSLMKINELNKNLSWSEVTINT